MEKDKSPIMTTSVSMGMTPKISNSTPVTGTKPMIMLIMSDFGLQSTSAERVTAADWNEFCSSHPIKISGTINDKLPDGVKPFFLEYQIESLQKFSTAAIIENSSILLPYRRALTIIDQLDRSKITASEAFEQIAQLQIAEPLKMKINQNLGVQTARNTPASTPVQIDSILSMMDLGATQETTSVKASTMSDDFIADVSSAAGAINVAAIQEQINSYIMSIAGAIQSSQLFYTTATQWYALKNILKIAGRDKSIQIYFASSDIEQADSVLHTILSQFSDQSSTPDLVLWGYRYSSTTSSLQALDQTSSIAENFKSLLVTSLDSKDQLAVQCASTLPVQTIIEHESMIPLRRLRKSMAARGCVLCTGAIHDQSDVDTFNQSECAWICAAQWVTSLVTNQTPYHWPQKLEPLSGFALTSEIKHGRLTDVSSAGLTMVHNPSQGYCLAPVVLLDTGEDSPYRSAGFNMLVNRTARLTVEWISSNSSGTVDERAEALRAHLLSELKPNHILSDDSALSIEVEQQTATINIDSDVYINSYPVQFQFSIEI